jgi:hypothetical protein
VRENRDVLIDLHRHIVWLLHSEAETEAHGGITSSDRPRGELRSYLEHEARGPDLADEFMVGMVERIVALVVALSRIVTRWLWALGRAAVGAAALSATTIVERRISNAPRAGASVILDTTGGLRASSTLGRAKILKPAVMTLPKDLRATTEG